LAERGGTAFLDDRGAMAGAIRAFDWHTTPLGPVEDWSITLKTAVSMILESKFPMSIFWGPQMITIYNDAFRPILGGKPEALGRPLQEVWHEVWDSIGPLAEKAFAGDATYIEDFPLTVERHGYAEQTYFTFCYSPIRNEAGKVAGMLDTVVETTSKMWAETNALRLNSELAHRTRNLFAIISAIVDQTFRTAVSKETAQAAISARMRTLAQAQEILSHSNKPGAAIQDVVRGALAPHRTAADQIAIDGPPLDLSPRQTLSLALALNELATNALKYGALSTGDGRVTVSWDIDAGTGGDLFRFAWREQGGPPVVKPLRRGFGSRLIERSLAMDFRGTVDISYEPDGMRCDLATTMRDLHIVAERDKAR
jgi:two-component sensor histidine kinase